ncbi:N-acetylneuraminate synthase [methane-oxidizing endosymbiont of Gigantopelta aegis]|uniref:N-acetylneuraminate synthase n=1 Tax=methane-oxidizing endosymbiont of Gigantopelta aegis TaxID=2794938 RepID=UPI0018DD15A1|nr:N-acetylneuraminate synthase [methane-oxidizing endosymbiont of Gigantopelta aegis]
MNSDHCYIIAEAGVNHNGHLDTAFELIDAAFDAGVDAVKFQIFKAEQLVTQNAEKAAYQKQNTGDKQSQYQMLKQLALSQQDYVALAHYCQQKSILFLSTAFDDDSLRFLVDELDVECLKIASGDVTNGPFLLAHAQTGKNIILSTGMATLAEVEHALSVLAYGFLDKDARPTDEALLEAYLSEQGRQQLQQKVTLLHCTSEYPAPAETINLKAMDTLAQAFSLPVGYSDHSAGIAIPVAAVARGACVIEKHFTLDKNQIGPDHKASLEPDALKMMVDNIRQVEAALGSQVKRPQMPEMATRKVARKSLVAARKIKKGEIFTEENLVVKRPGTGISPMQYWQLLGQASSKLYQPDDLIE